MSAETSPYRVLFVEDDSDLRELVRTALRRYGYDVDLCDNGAEALQRLREERYDVLTTDFVLDDLSGAELCRTIRRWWPDLPVIVLTGDAAAEEEARAAGASRFLIKPVTMDELESTLRGALVR